MKINKRRIKHLLRKNGWSQNELARQLYVPKGTVSNIITGKRNIGKKLQYKLFTVFPDENYKKLFIDESEVDVNASRG